MYRQLLLSVLFKSLIKLIYMNHNFDKQAAWIHVDHEHPIVPTKGEKPNVYPVILENSSIRLASVYSDRSINVDDGSPANAVKYWLKTEYTMITQRIMCSAIHVQDGKEYDNQPVDTGFVICGRRHNQCVSIIALMGGTGTYHNDMCVFGFMTSDGQFVDRKEAFTIAKAAGQLLMPNLYDPSLNPGLSSEDLW